MIYLYSGTPGSGKSLHAARVIYYSLLRRRPVICNFDVSREHVKNYDLFFYVENSQLTPDYLMKYAVDYFGNRPVREGSIILFIDECQMMFNARSWDAQGRESWNKFFQVHRHYGYDIILIAQFDRMIDRQIRSLIEYEIVHRKVSNFGLKGKLLCGLLLAPKLFSFVKIWYPMKEKVSSELFRSKKKYYRLYDTYADFNSE